MNNDETIEQKTWRITCAIWNIDPAEIGKKSAQTRTVFKNHCKMIELAIAEEREARKPELYRHLKTGVIYELICSAYSESELLKMAIYRGPAGNKWVRPMKEFDEKFVKVPAAPKAEVSE